MKELKTLSPYVSVVLAIAAFGWMLGIATSLMWPPKVNLFHPELSHIVLSEPVRTQSGNQPIRNGHWVRRAMVRDGKILSASPPVFVWFREGGEDQMYGPMIPAVDRFGRSALQ